MNKYIHYWLGRLKIYLLLSIVGGAVFLIGWLLIVHNGANQLFGNSNANQNVTVAENLSIGMVATQGWKKYVNNDEWNYEKYSLLYPPDWTTFDVPRTVDGRTYLAAIQLGPKSLEGHNEEGEGPDPNIFIERGPTISPSQLIDTRTVMINGIVATEGTLTGIPNKKFFYMESKSGAVYEVSWPMSAEMPVMRQILATLQFVK